MAIWNKHIWIPLHLKFYRWLRRYYSKNYILKKMPDWKLKACYHKYNVVRKGGKYIPPKPAVKLPKTIEGIDYAWGYYSGLSSKLKKYGKKFVMRYVSISGNKKNITKREVNSLKKLGIGIGIVFETTARRALKGYMAGKHDAEKARAQVIAAGLLRNMVIYFAVDFDATTGQQSIINDYLKGASSVLGKDKVGVYGGYWVVKRALNARVCKYAWQTYAWSYGKLDARVNIYQYKNGVNIAGVDSDLDKTLTADNGIVF